MEVQRVGRTFVSFFIFVIYEDHTGVQMSLQVQADDRLTRQQQSLQSA